MGIDIPLPDNSVRQGIHSVREYYITDLAVCTGLAKAGIEERARTRMMAEKYFMLIVVREQIGCIRMERDGNRRDVREECRK